MPELPEVETLRRELANTLIGKKITEVCIHHPAVIRQPSPDLLKKELCGQTIKNILRRAKVLIWELSAGKSLVIHLKMTGQLVFPGGGKQSRVFFKFSDGSSLDFNDQRLFAELRVLDDWRKLKFIQELGPEPFDLNKDEFKKMLSGKKSKIKPLLMDQKFISGIGNLYAAEVLFRARLDPNRQANGLSQREKDKLFQAIKDILKKAIESGGSSIDDYVRLSGKPGGYVKYHKVYGRENKPCFVCNSQIKRIALGGRGTYFCPKCQK
jgi:formamidopyrimidine-DNA glycosylase